ncbi:MFS transporter [Streptomyces sp. NPDC048309]|uniref:MFS transporter n=1 Tax=Streptomyces sp. NPDC048309 TaxID=3154618 RepID=UPI0033C5A0FD
MTTSTQTAKAATVTSPDLRRLVASECASLSGSAVSTVALPTLAVLELHASTTQIAALAFLGQLPNAVVALPAGALSDRYAKRPQMIAADLTAAAGLATIPAAAFAGVLGIGQLYAVAVVLGITKIVHDAAAISYLPILVEPHLLQRANSRLGAASSVADSAGSNAGAALVGAVGAARSLLADVLAYLLSALLVWRIRTPEPVAAPPPGGRRTLARDIGEGLRYVAGQPTIRTVIAALSTLSFGLAVMNTYWAYHLLVPAPGSSVPAGTRSMAPTARSARPVSRLRQLTVQELRSVSALPITGWCFTTGPTRSSARWQIAAPPPSGKDTGSVFARCWIH